MLYNKNVTSVEVYVSSPGSKDAVSAAVENMILEWSTNGYPAVTREFIAPYTLMDLPKCKSSYSMLNGKRNYPN